MPNSPILVQLPLFPDSVWPAEMPGKQADLHTCWLQRDRLPDWVTKCPTVMRSLDLFGPLHLGDLPERNLQRNWRRATVSNACKATLAIHVSFRQLIDNRDEVRSAP